MELRLLRYFVAVAEELHLARAAERLGVEQSPVSRAMRDLEAMLGVCLFDRSGRRTRLTWAGRVFLDESRRVLAHVNHATNAAKAAARGCNDTLRIAVSDALGQRRVATLLALSREEEPELDIQIFELSLVRQVRRLHAGLLDVGFVLSDVTRSGITAECLWHDCVSVLLPVRHPLLAHAEISVADALRFPLVLYHPDTDSADHSSLHMLLKASCGKPQIANKVDSLGAMLTLIAAGYGIGFVTHSVATALNRSDIVLRPLAGQPVRIDTYLLLREGDISEPVRRFIERARAVA